MSLPIIKLAGLALTGVVSVVGYHAITSDSASAGMQAGPVCITQKAEPGNSYSAPVTVVNPGPGQEGLRLSVGPLGPPAGPAYPAGGHPLPASWVSLGDPGLIAPGHSATARVTVNIPGSAHPGRYGAALTATSVASTSPHAASVQVELGAGAATWLEVSVGVPPPPRAFCRGERPTYWPWTPPLPVCKHSQAPLHGRNAMCRVLPLSPPGANARNCHLIPKGTPAQERKAWAQYKRQLGHGVDQYGRPMSQDAHCVVRGHILNLPRDYHGQYRIADNGQTGPVSNARTY